MAVAAYDRRKSDFSIRLFNWRNIWRIDPMMTLCVLLLAAAGWGTLYSASHYGDVSIFWRQVGVFLPCVAIALFIVAIDHRFLVACAPAMYIVAVVLLALVLGFGHTAKGSERWLDLGFVRIQPSEMTKVVVVYTLAWYLNLLGERIRRFHWFALSFILAGIPMGLILLQPNLGTAAAIGPIVMVMLFVAGCRFWHIGLVVCLGLCLVPVLWLEMKDFDPAAKPHGTVVEEADVKVNPPSMLGFKDYQKRRIYSFLHPEYDPQGTGWHTYQSKITVGSGGLSGKGYMEGTQTRLNYLPEHHTDFIFSLLAEEHGFIGVVVVLGLFAAFFLRGLMFARDSAEMTGTLLASGIVTLLFFHVFVNIAITVGLMPVTGIPLPFLSYGRSFYLTTMLCVGVLLNVPMRNRLFAKR